MTSLDSIERTPFGFLGLSHPGSRGNNTVVARFLYDQTEKVSDVAHGIYFFLEQQSLVESFGRRREIILIDQVNCLQKRFAILEESHQIKKEILRNLSRDKSQIEMERKMENDVAVHLKYHKKKGTAVHVYCPTLYIEKYAEPIIKMMVNNFKINFCFSDEECRIVTFIDKKTGVIILKDVDLPRIKPEDKERFPDTYSKITYSSIIEQLKTNIVDEAIEKANERQEMDIIVNPELKPPRNKPCIKQKEADTKEKAEKRKKVQFADSADVVTFKTTKVDEVRAAEIVEDDFVEEREGSIKVPLSHHLIQVPKIISVFSNNDSPCQIDGVKYYNLLDAFISVINSNKELYIDDEGKIILLVMLIIKAAERDPELKNLLEELKYSGDSIIVAGIEIEKGFGQKHDLWVDKNLLGQALMRYRATIPVEKEERRLIDEEVYSYPFNKDTIGRLIRIMESKHKPFIYRDFATNKTMTYPNAMAAIIECFSKYPIEDVSKEMENIIHELVNQNGEFEDLLKHDNENGIFFYQYDRLSRGRHHLKYERLSRGKHPLEFYEMLVLSSAVEKVRSALIEKDKLIDQDDEFDLFSHAGYDFSEPDEQGDKKEEGTVPLSERFKDNYDELEEFTLGDD